MQVKGDKSRAKKASEKDKNEILGFEALAAMQKVLAEKNDELVQMKERLDVARYMCHPCHTPSVKNDSCYTRNAAQCTIM